MLFHLDILLFILLTKTQIKWIHNIFMDVQIMCKSISLLRLLLYVIMFIDWKTEAACNFIKKETLAHVFSCEFCEISKNTFFTEHLWTTASRKRFFTSWGSTFHHFQKQPQDAFYKKAALKNFLIFTGKHLCWSLFFIKL